jgi:hypothetical protein
MARKKTTVYIEDSLLRATKVLAAAQARKSPRSLKRRSEDT